MLVLGLGGAILTFESGDVSVSLTGMSLAAIVGIILNLTLPKCETTAKTEEVKVEVKEEVKEEVVEAEATTKECPFCCSTIAINAKNVLIVQVNYNF